MYYYPQFADTLKHILKVIFICIIKNNIVMKEKVHDDVRKAAKTPSMIYHAEGNDNILWTCPWENESQWRVNDF